MSADDKAFALTIHAQLAGYPVELVIPTCQAGQLPGLVARLRELGLTPPAGPQPPAADEDSWGAVEQAAARRATARANGHAGLPPRCDEHGTEMRPGRHGWYCPRKNRSGAYCEHRISFKDVPAPVE